MYTTTSNEVSVTDKTAVSDLLNDYYFTVEPTITDSRISFFADAKPNSAFDVYKTPEQRESVVEEFLTRLSDFLTDSFEIKCVEVEGDGEPDAWKWHVDTTGAVTQLNL